MSDEELSSMEDDFSASEDEWKPGKTHRQATDDDSDDDDSDFADGTPGSKKRDSKSNLSTSKTEGGAVKQTKKRKSSGTSLRTKLFNKYKPPPKTVRNQSIANKTAEQSHNTGKSTKKKAVRASKKNEPSDSDSSGDDYLVNPNELNLQSSFFDVKPSTSSGPSGGPPVFDCNAGVQLTDSEEGDDDDDDDETESMIDIAKGKSSADAPTEQVDLSYLQNFAHDMEKAKVQYKKHKDRSLATATANVDVSSLLAMGEGAAIPSTAPIKNTKDRKRQTKKAQPSQAAADTDSDWEEVEGDDHFASTAQPSEILANGIQVCVDLPQRQRKDKKTIDVEATLKRQLNRVIKENQIFLHKVSLLGHIYHGLFLNKVTNNVHLMPIALKLLPSNNAYPSGQTEIKYFQSMVTWFKTAIKIMENRMYPKLNVKLVTSLAVQMKYRHAVCKRDYILMFVVLLRAMGMQCRLVVNLVPMPLKPPQSSLCSLKMKPADGGDKKKLAVKKEPVAPKKEKGSIKQEPLKSPPLSMEEREELRNKVEALENEIKKQKKEKMQPKPSFEEVLETKLPQVPKPNGKSKDSSAKKSDRKRKPLDNSADSDSSKKAKLATEKSPFFSDSKQASIQKEEHSKSFDDEEPSITVNSKQKPKPVQKAQKQLTTRNTRNKTEVLSSDSKQTQKVIPDIVIVSEGKQNQENITNRKTATARNTRATRSRSTSPKVFISPTFLQTKVSKSLHTTNDPAAKRGKSKSPTPSASASTKSYISTEFLKNKPKATKVEVKVSENPSPRKLRSKTKITIPQLDGANDLPKAGRKQKLKKQQSNNSDDDFQPTAPKKSKPVERLKNLDRRVLSPDIAEEELSPSKMKKNAVNMWVEVYSELEAQWVCLDLFKGKVNCVDTIRKSVTPSTLAYVFAFNNDATLKDVTPRYCAQWAAVVRKGRVDQDWLDEAISQYVTKSRLERDLTEDMDMRRIHLDKPMPTTISEYKDNPLYALERHLLKFQAIYPPNALTLGFVRGEPVYARECVHTLHSREIWLKSARVVKLGEKPYKIVKARPKWDKFTSTVIKDQPLEIFGYWQTQQYEPPTAENGIVPRNAYGNVELFKECMLPKKTVHLHLPGLNRVCKKLGIDCVPAVIGFDFHQGACHPLYDGFVVCEEFAEIAYDAWDKEQQNAERKEQEKYEARVYGNWKKLIKGLLIRERLKIKYNF